MDKTNLIIKAAGDWELDVLGVPFGSPDDRDSDKQFFSANTQLHLREGEVTNVYYYHGYTPDGKPQDAPRARIRRNYGATFGAAADW